MMNNTNDKIISDFNAITLLTQNRDETILVGKEIGLLLSNNDILCLDGDLGAGKTAFTSGVAIGIGVKGIVSSPTFTILIEHTRSERLALYHFDAYRLECADDFYDLGFDEYLCNGGVCVIEWADRIDEVLPESSIRIRINQKFDDVSDVRLLTFCFPKDDKRYNVFVQTVVQKGIAVYEGENNSL